MGHIPSGVGVWTVFFFLSVWEEGMCGDWSFPETSKRIRRRRRGGGVACGKSLPGGGGEGYFLEQAGGLRNNMLCIFFKS